MKTPVLISFAVSAMLVCVFVFAYAKCWFSRDVAQKIHAFQILVQFSPLGRVNLPTTCRISSGLEMIEFSKLPVETNTQPWLQVKYKSKSSVSYLYTCI